METNHLIMKIIEIHQNPIFETLGNRAVLNNLMRLLKPQISVLVFTILKIYMKRREA
jgi:hypothetical protein